MASAPKKSVKPSKRTPKPAKKVPAPPPGKSTPASRAAAKAVKSAAKSKKWRAEKSKVMVKVREYIPDVATIKAVAPITRSETGKGSAIIYTPELDEQLFDLVSTGVSLEKISRIEGMPCLATLLKWVATKSHPFSSTYPRAKENLIALYEERALAAATETRLAETETRRVGMSKGESIDVTEIRTGDAVERSKLEFQAYSWALGYMAPKKHGRQSIASDSSDTALDELLGEFRKRNGGEGNE